MRFSDYRSLMTDHWLLAEAEALDQGLVPGAVFVPEVAEQAGALADHLEEAPPAGVVLLVELEVLVELVDPRGEQRDLDLRRAGVGVAPLVLADDLRLAVLGDAHRPRRPPPPCHSCRMTR